MSVCLCICSFVVVCYVFANKDALIKSREEQAHKSFTSSFLFLCVVEANIGSEDSSLSDALVLDDGESHSRIRVLRLMLQH